MKTSKTLCVLPWMHIATSPSGNLRVCCNSVSGENLIVRPNGKPYKIYDKDLKEAWHSSVYTKIREQMLKGERPKMCSQCFREEDASLESPRLNYAKKYGFNQEYSKTPTWQVKYFDIRLGNKCNLRCRMCNPFSSQLLFKEHKALSNLNFKFPLIPLPNKTEKEFKKHMNWMHQIKPQKLVDYMKFVEEIYFAGGEPLIIKEQNPILEELIQRKMSKNIVLKYSTNLTKLNQEILSYWTHFKKIQLNISIDAYGKLNDYIRDPSQWSQIEKNIEKLLFIDKYKKKITNTDIIITTTVQMYNITQIKDLLRWLKLKKLKVYFNILDYPKFLNIRTLPQSLKNKAEQDLLKFENDFPVQKIIKYMKQENWSHYLNDFVRYTDFIDKFRKQSIKSVLPQWELYKKDIHAF